MIVLTCINLVPFMGKRESDKAGMHTQDKQLRGLSIEVAMEKRRLDQALNAKEFALCAGVSYSTARHWFHLPGFPVFHGVVFWQDFVHWRMSHYGYTEVPASLAVPDGVVISGLPPRAAQLLSDV
jgi:hypothetical protein